MDSYIIVLILNSAYSNLPRYTFYTLVRHDSELVNPKAALLLTEKKPKAAKKPKAKK